MFNKLCDFIISGMWNEIDSSGEHDGEQDTLFEMVLKLMHFVYFKYFKTKIRFLTKRWMAISHVHQCGFRLNR